MSVGNPVATIAIVDDNSKMQQQFRGWTQEITAAINELQVLTGTGSPEGVVTANPTRLYMDNNGTAGVIVYIKQTGSGNTGWVLQ